MVLEEVEWYHVAAAVLLFALAVIVLASSASQDLLGNRGQLAIVKINGPLSFDNDIQSRSITPGSISSLTSQAESDGADAILYEINSGGGSVVASKHAAAVVEEAEVPTVCLMKEVAASGAYWISSACDVIVADSLSLTGSIGVTSTYLEFSGLLDRFGVEYVNLTSGEFKDMGSRFKNLTPEERDRFDRILETVHSEFVEDIAENRGMSVDEVRDAATGEIFLGERAQELGLVDRLGDRDTAIEVAKNLTNKTTLATKTYEPPQRFNILSLLFSRIGEGIVTGLKASPEKALLAAE